MGAIAIALRAATATDFLTLAHNSWEAWRQASTRLAKEDHHGSFGVRQLRGPSEPIYKSEPIAAVACAFDFELRWQAPSGEVQVRIGEPH